MMMINSYQTPPNISSIGAVCYWRTPVELVPSEGKAYNLFFVTAQGECNISDNT